MAIHEFHDEYSLAEATDKLGKKALQLGLIRGFVVHYFPDNRQYYVPNEKEAEALTPEEAYMKFKRLIERSGK